MNIMPDENQIENGNRASGENSVWEFVKVVIISLLIVIPIRTWIAQPFIVEGASMVPNFHNGEYLIIDEISYAMTAPKRGEVIVSVKSVRIFHKTDNRASGRNCRHKRRYHFHKTAGLQRDARPGRTIYSGQGLHRP